MQSINKDTKIYCSFSTSPGNNGCIYFNKKFQENNINAIYKSFYSDDIEKSIQAVKTLGIAGFAVSMPFKLEVLQYVDEVSEDVKQIGAANTIINNNGYLKAYNTDWLGVSKYILENVDFLSILGNGGSSSDIGIYGPDGAVTSKVHQLMFYNRQLSDTEIVDNYNAIYKSRIRT